MKMIHGRGAQRVPADQPLILFKDAAWPAPFKPGLEYNSPCHGTWNIVHIGMAVPGAHQIYVCGANCNRGVVLTAAEMKAQDRYSTLTLFENDLIDGDMENLIIEGVGEILDRLPAMPPLVFLFTVCVHRFMGVDLDHVYRELRSRFPQVIFVESTMEPISQKHGLTPEQRLRDGMFSFLSGEPEEKQVGILGSDFPLDEACELKEILAGAGMKVRETSACETFEDYCAIGKSSYFICPYPTGRYGAERTASRLGRPCLYLPASFSFEEIDSQLEKLSGCLPGIRLPDIGSLKAQCLEDLASARQLIGDCPIAIDAHAVPRFLGLARLLISQGFQVIRLYGDAFSPEEEEDYLWLKDHAPNLELASMIHTGMRVLPRGQKGKVLAIGQKAAYFHQTPYFVNMVQGGGLHGYEGIRRMTELMKEAFLEEKDTRDLVGRKGLGCESY